MTEEQTLRTLGFTLANGMKAELRPILPADAPLLEEGFIRLSAWSRFARFGMGMDHLSNQELQYLTDVDLVSHVAWGATISDEAAGVARYVILADGESAEVAVTVVDPFQRIGLGTVLFQALVAVARHDGLVRFNFEVDPSNAPVRKMLDRVVSGPGESGLMHGEARVDDLTESSHDTDLVELMDHYRVLRQARS